MEQIHIHNVLAKKAREASYSNLEVEQINYMIDDALIRYYLDRETKRLLANVEIKEEDLKAIYENNKDKYMLEERVKIETIFLKDVEKAKEILTKVNLKNFAKLKKENDEKANPEADEFINVSNILPEIVNLLIGKKPHSVINELAIVNEGAHIILFKEKEDVRPATYEEARNFIIENVKASVYEQAQNQIINDILNESVTVEKIETEEKKEEKSEGNK